MTLKSICQELLNVYKCYPNNFFSGFYYILKALYWHLIIKNFYTKKWEDSYIYNIKLLYDKRFDWYKYSYYLPKIDYIIKLLEFEYLKKWDTFFDVWSNIWNHALIWILQGADTHVFEPNKDVLNSFLKNIKLNNFDENNVSINNVLVWSIKDRVSFYQYPKHCSWLSSLIEPKNLKWIDILEIEKINLDYYIKENNIENIKILKIDAEWAEKEIILSMNESLSKNMIDIIYWESNWLTNIKVKNEILNFLNSKWYTNLEFNILKKRFTPYKDDDNCMSILNNKIDKIETLIASKI